VAGAHTAQLRYALALQARSQQRRDHEVPPDRIVVTERQHRQTAVNKLNLPVELDALEARQLF
jgi:hypothetical protein